MYLFIDESGYDNDWIFVGVKIQNIKLADECVHRWRQRTKQIYPKLQVNEYKDCRTHHKQREQILRDIAKREMKYWAILFSGYRGHKADYVKAIVNLLKYCDLQDIKLVMLDKVEKNSSHMQKHIRAIKEDLGMVINVNGCESEKEKGIQIADAICGSLARHYLNRSGLSYFHLISHLSDKPMLIIK